MRLISLTSLVTDGIKKLDALKTELLQVCVSVSVSVSVSLCVLYITHTHTHTGVRVRDSTDAGEAGGGGAAEKVCEYLILGLFCSFRGLFLGLF
jgi:hypothetical protein